MIKLRRVVLCLALCALLLSGCAPTQVSIVETTPIPRVDTVLPSVNDAEGLTTQAVATLYFRFLSEPFLTTESRAVLQQPGQPYELALLTELLAGPSTRSAELTAPFPAGLRVISTVRQGRILFVTLSDEIMNKYPDEPAAWRTDPVWANEVLLRRVLCLQAMVATVTENCDVDQVQFLMAQTGVTGSLRLKQSYYLDGAAPDALTGPIRRDASLLLTPDTVVDTALTCWRQQDWQRLYHYVAERDPLTGIERLQFRDFAAQMTLLPRLIDHTRSSGSLSAAGNAATYAIGATLLDDDGHTREVSDRIMHLCRDGGPWKISLSQLTGWLEE